MNNITCAVCDKPLNRYYAMRVGGIVEQVTGKRFMCRECVKDIQTVPSKFAMVRRDTWEGLTA